MWSTRVKARARRLLPPTRGEAVILLYHRIDSPARDPWGNCVTPQRFAEQLDAVRSSFEALRLDDLVDALARGTVPPRSVCLTFDDGYRDNLYEAKPLLERYSVPATVFVVSGHVGSGRNFWWDELEAALFGGSALPPLRLELRSEVFEWAGVGETDSPPPAWRAWKRPSTKRQALYTSLYWKLRGLSHDERLSVLAGLREQIGRVEEKLLTSSGEEIRTLGLGPCVSIGAHTVTHPPLTSLTPDEQRLELGGSKQALEELLGRAVDAVSYPFSAVDDQTVAVAREAGFAYACAGGDGPVRRTSPTLGLPRLSVGDWPAEEFVARISNLLRASREAARA